MADVAAGPNRKERELGPLEFESGRWLEAVEREARPLSLLAEASGGRLLGDEPDEGPGPYLTVRVPSMPASACPGTVQRKV